jgi:hypothetical protein
VPEVWVAVVLIPPVRTGFGQERLSVVSFASLNDLTKWFEKWSARLGTDGELLQLDTAHGRLHVVSAEFVPRPTEPDR